MCGRVAVPESDVLKEFDIKVKGPEWTKDINVPPTGKVPVIANGESREAELFNWTLIPWYAKPDPKTGKPINKLSTFNARYDKLLTSNIWKPVIEHKQTCLVLVNGYYEWEELDEWADEKRKKKKKQPHFIRQKGADFTSFAGLYNNWTNKQTGEIFKTCTVITHEAVEAWGKIHDRMPAFLTEETANIWLNKESAIEELMQAILPVSEDFLESVEINTVGDIDEFEHVIFK